MITHDILTSDNIECNLQIPNKTIPIPNKTIPIPNKTIPTETIPTETTSTKTMSNKTPTLPICDKLYFLFLLVIIIGYIFMICYMYIGIFAYANPCTTTYVHTPFNISSKFIVYIQHNKFNIYCKAKTLSKKNCKYNIGSSHQYNEAMQYGMVNCKNETL